MKKEEEKALFPGTAELKKHLITNVPWRKALTVESQKPPQDLPSLLFRENERKKLASFQQPSQGKDPVMSSFFSLHGDCIL